MNWRARWARLYSPLLVVLSMVLIVLLIAVAFRLGFVSRLRLVENKDLIDASTKLLGTLVLTLGAVASYFRFFKGRTLSPRLTIETTVEVFPFDESTNFHAVSIEVSNVGSVAIWGLEPRVEITYHRSDGKTQEDVGKWWTPLDLKDGKARVKMLDTGESSQFVVDRRVPINVRVATYVARVSLSDRYSWHRVTHASNCLQADQQAALTK